MRKSVTRRSSSRKSVKSSTNSLNQSETPVITPPQVINPVIETEIDPDMKQYMDMLANNKVRYESVKSNLFDPNKLKMVNASVRNDNYYMLDKYGLVIRKECQNSKKTAFGWKYYEDEPVNIHIGDLLLKTNSKDIQIITLQQIKEQFPTVFNAPRGVIYKVYSEMFPNIDLNNL